MYAVIGQFDLLRRPGVGVSHTSVCSAEESLKGLLWERVICLVCVCLCVGGGADVCVGFDVLGTGSGAGLGILSVWGLVLAKLWRGFKCGCRVVCLKGNWRIYRCGG